MERTPYCARRRGRRILFTLALAAGFTVALLAAAPAEASASGGDGPGVVRGNDFYLREDPSGGPADHDFRFGRNSDTAIVGDWNGDGRQTVGVVRGNRFHLRNAHRGGAADISFAYGRAGDVPIAGDWNGDGRDTIGIVRGNRFHLRNRNAGGAADRSFTYGAAGDAPIAGDWNGDGRDTIGIVRGNRFHLRNRNAGGAADISFTYGRSGDTPLAGDWNADGTTTIGVARENHFHLRNRNRGGAADLGFRYGRPGDTPIAGGWSESAAAGPTLRLGDSGDDVRQLQRALRGEGYWLGGINGRFDEVTRQAVYAFQKVNRLPATGVFDDEEYEALANPRSPSPRSSSGRVLELDLRNQILMVVENGRVRFMFHTSPGHGQWYTFQGSRFRATTTTGQQRIDRQIDGIRTAERGQLYRPKYFDSRRGIAIHGFSSVPPRAVSAGCVRVTNAAMDFLWSSGLADVGTSVWVYPNDFYR